MANASGLGSGSSFASGSSAPFGRHKRKLTLQRHLWTPPWFAPDWKDDGTEREQSDFPIRDGVMDQVRPALRRDDDAKNPTEYARRFGIFPGRKDGRSRTSPTRASTRSEEFLDGVARTGQDVVRHFQNLAGQRRLEDFMIEHGRNRAQQNPATEDPAFAEAYENLAVDEFWQEILFGDLTMEELTAGGYFKMGPVPTSGLGLQGPLHPLLQRDRWRQTAYEFQPDYYRFSYCPDDPSLQGNTSREVDARVNDEIWNALQPALQLATRLLNADEPYIRALQDITKWCAVPPHLDNRRKKTSPLIQFCRDPDPRHTIVGSIPQPPSASFDPLKNCMDVLDRVFMIRLGPGNYHQKDRFSRLIVQGDTYMPEILPGYPIIVTISFDAVWPLVMRSYSESEKLVVSFIIATTIVHEIMHAIEFATCLWTNFPTNFGILDPADVLFCARFVTKLKGALTKLHPHLRFEDHLDTEVGHAYENHVLGGGAWPFGSVWFRAKPNFLQMMPVIAVATNLTRFSSLAASTTVGGFNTTSDSNRFLKVVDMAKLFHQTFWDSFVSKFGMSAVKTATTSVSKIMTNDDPQGAQNVLYALDPAHKNEWDQIAKLIKDMNRKNLYTLGYYVYLLAMDGYAYGEMLRKFIDQAALWRTQERQIVEHISDIMLIASESRADAFGARPDAHTPQIQTLLQTLYEDWRKVRSVAPNRFVDQYAPPLLDSAATFYVRVDGARHRCEDRINSKLIALCTALVHEQGYQEGMVAHLYRIPAGCWPRYLVDLPGHKDVWTARLTRVYNTLQQVIMLLSHLHQEASFPSWPGWKAELLRFATSFRNIRDLVQQPSPNVHRNWIRNLATVPVLRASTRRDYERWYFLAVREMIKLNGAEMARLTAFRNTFYNLLHLEDHKIVQASTPLNERMARQRWAGLLDGMVKDERKAAQVAAAMAQGSLSASGLRRRGRGRRGRGHGHGPRGASQGPVSGSSLPSTPAPRPGSAPPGSAAASSRPQNTGSVHQASSTRPSTLPQRRDSSTESSASSRISFKHNRPDQVHSSRTRTSAYFLPQMVEPRLSRNPAPLGSLVASTGTDSQEAGLGWRDAAESVNKPFGRGQVADGSTRARLVPHSYTINDGAIDQLYDEVMHKVKKTRLTEQSHVSTTAGAANAEAEGDDGTMPLSELEQSILEEQKLHEELVLKAATYIAVAHEKADEEKKLAADAQERAKAIAEASGTASEAGEVPRGRKRRREEDEWDNFEPVEQRAKTEFEERMGGVVTFCKPARLWSFD